jgi:phosphoribosylamine---glycine ligase
MRILGVGDDISLGDMYLALMAEGHEVQVCAEGCPGPDDVFAGMVATCRDWRAALPWIRAAGSEGVIVFETAHHGDTQHALRRDGYHVIGGSPLGDRLEADRPFGQEVAREHMAVCIAPSHRFTDFDEAIRFVATNRRRFVYKCNGIGFASSRNYVGVASDGCDLIAWLANQRQRWAYAESPDFVLMEHVTGVEIGVGAYFNGECFLEPACLDWEHKRFFAGDLGELTGEMGTLVTYRGAARLFDATLRRIAPLLASDGYVGYINLNTIVNDRGIWPLEFTCRFGYPGFAILSALQSGGWGALCRAMISRDAPTFPTASGYAVGVVLTVPPFPYSDGYERLSKGMPIALGTTTHPADRTAIHFGEVALRDGQLITAGEVGYIAVVTGCGPTAEDAQREAYSHVGQVVIPNMRYRTDIGDAFVRRDRATLERLGYLPPA